MVTQQNECSESYLKAHLPKEAEIGSKDDACAITLYDVEKLHDVLAFLRDDEKSRYAQLIDVSGSDYPERDERFEVVYNLLSLKLNRRIRIYLRIEEDVSVPSVVPLFNAANWFEREVFDMYGIVFDEHPDLRRILTDYGFSGHPLRKDFPLTGHVEVRYDFEKERVVYEPVHLPQEFRQFDFASPWEGPNYVLPGDEKASA